MERAWNIGTLILFGLFWLIAMGLGSFCAGCYCAFRCGWGQIRENFPKDID